MAYTTIDDPSQYFQADTYTGGQTITFDGNSDLQPDWIWIKARTTAENWRTFDTSRGVGSSTDATKGLVISGAAAEEEYEIITSMNSDGVSLNTSDAFLNSSSHTYSLSAWKFNGGSTSAISSGGDIGIATTSQVESTAKHSLQLYTGTGSQSSIGHGLSVAPDWIIIKNRDQGDRWFTWFRGDGINTNQGLFLNATDTLATTNGFMGNENPTSVFIGLGTGHDTNASGEKYVCYTFSSVQGYSKFGTYEGNGDADGPLVYTGFKPAWVLMKNADNANNWVLHDNARSPNPEPGNLVDEQLSPNSTNTEATDSSKIDILSDGFKCRVADQGINNSGHTICYAAFAQNPFVTSKGVPVTAG